MARARRQIVGEKLAKTLCSFMAKTLSSIISDFSDVAIIFNLLIWIQEYIERSLYTNYFLNFDRLTSYFHLKKYIYIYISSINTSWNIFLINNNNNNFSFNKSAIKLSFFLFYSKYLKIKYTRSLIIWSMIYIYTIQEVQKMYNILRIRKIAGTNWHFQ